MSEFEKPAAELVGALADLVEKEDWGALVRLFGADATRKFRDVYNADPKGLVDRLRDTAEACKARFVQDASEQLMRLSRNNFSQFEPQDIGEQLQTMLDPNRNLLEVAFAYKLIGLVRPAAKLRREPHT